MPALPDLTVSQYASICDSLPDPTFILTESGRYAAVFGGKDSRYYHDGSFLVGKFLYEVLVPSKTDWFMAQIRRALINQQMMVVEYELSGSDVLGLPAEGPVEPIWFEGRISALPQPVASEAAVVWVASNITSTKKLQKQLHQLAMSDELTGLRNRRYFIDSLRHAFDNYKRYDKQSCLMYFDVDHFKAINDTHGHPAGDKALCDLAAAIQQVLAVDDEFCRLGGDEFALLCPGRSPDEVAALAHGLLRCGQVALQPYATADVVPTLSLGMAHFQSSDTSMHCVMQRADQALYANRLHHGHASNRVFRFPHDH